ncbi:DUF4190 domain-containing protein [Desertivibrio insolitus]|uniref:DUF4190 domain-containing protein n=1 Tax=Herbiconiux sp. SYSU D00978 TaxID=2812562 RepID=UPI001A95FB2D|nr:DUF4190 domain-containing protein [Herbiconiux sp. SYSU D00978]
MSDQPPQGAPGQFGGQQPGPGYERPGAVPPPPGAVHGPPVPPSQLYDAYGRPVVVTPPSTLSITSMVLSIAGFLLMSVGIGIFASIAGLITGYMARTREPHARGYWLTGIIAGWVGVGLTVLFIVFFIAIFAIAGTAAFLPFIFLSGEGFS